MNAEFPETNLTIPPDAWEPMGPDDDEDAKLTCVILVNGSRHYLEAYAVHPFDDRCDCVPRLALERDSNSPRPGLAWLRNNMHTFGEDDLHVTHDTLDEEWIDLRDAHQIIARAELLTIGKRTYMLFMEPGVSA